MRLVELSTAPEHPSAGLTSGSLYKPAGSASPLLISAVAADGGGGGHGYGAYGSDLARSALEQQLELAEREVSVGGRWG